MKVSKWLPVAGLLLLLVLGGAFTLSPPKQADPWPKALEDYLGQPAYKTVDPDKPLHQQTSTFTLAGRTFEMPTVYISSNIANQEEIDGLNLLYVLPDYTSRADFADRDEYEQARNDRRFGHMLVEPFASWPSSFEKAIANHHHSMEKVERVGIFDGLEIEKWFQERQGQLHFYHQVYIERDEQGKIISFIECSTLDRPSVRFPGCSHRFVDKGLLYKVHYNQEKYLLEWRAMRASAIAFVDSFEKSPQP